LENQQLHERWLILSKKEIISISQTGLSF